MIISLIGAMDRNRGIGYQNDLPWKGKVPADMKHFREVTTGHTICMGRKTFDAIGKPLPNRNNIVLTRDPHWQSIGVTTSNFYKHAFEDAAASGETEFFVIGGQTLFEQMLALRKIDRMYLTLIDGVFPADKYFPEWKTDEWKEVFRETISPDEKNCHGLTFLTLDRA